ncbi:MAG: hypothetical protein WA002_13765, partial [Candidatus Acidiferrales bacterium]
AMPLGLRVRFFVSAFPRPLSRQRQNRELGSDARTDSKMVIDSSGTCDGERRMAVGNALGDCG